MTITEANAANEVANELLILAATGAKVTPAMEHGAALLLVNANKVLSAGFDAKRFLSALARVRSAIA